MISIVIPFYRQIDNINLILKALERQSYQDFEITLAEDEHNEASKKHVLALIDQSPLDVSYIRQTENVGFTKTKIFNKAICYHLYHKKGYEELYKKAVI